MYVIILLKLNFIITNVEENKMYLIHDVWYRGIKYTDKTLKYIKVGCPGYIYYIEFIDGTSLSEFVDYVYKSCNGSTAKNIINCFLGL